MSEPDAEEPKGVFAEDNEDTVRRFLGRLALPLVSDLSDGRLLAAPSGRLPVDAPHFNA